MNLQSIVSLSTVRTARSLIHSRDAETLDEQIRLVAIPAPTGCEGKRGEYLQQRFLELGLREVGVDEVGNVLGTLPENNSSSAGDARPVLLGAHLDTIFPPETEIRVRRDGKRVFAPGITDNARGLAAMLAVAAVLREVGIRTERPLSFVATVGEEGLGDLRGVKHLFRPESRFAAAEAFISLDGAGLTRIVNRAIGATRIRATILGSGGHSWGDRGMPNPAHALGLAIAALREMGQRVSATSTVTVGRLGGGTSVNSIPSEAWMEVDLRSDDPPRLRGLEGEARKIIERAVRTEADTRTRSGPLKLTLEPIGNRPCGETPAASSLVEASTAATRIVGAVPELTASSTDANVAMSLGIPAVTIGAGGRAGGVHTVEEWFDNTGGAQGIERALLTVLAAAGVRRARQEG